MLTNIDRLLFRSHSAKALCESALMKLNQQEKALQMRHQALRYKYEQLTGLLDMKKLTNVMVTRSQIFENLRKIAVIQQQMSLLLLEKKQLISELNTLRSEKHHYQLERKAWIRKEQKYEKLKSVFLERKNRADLLKDENEQEELFNGQGFKRHHSG